MVEEVTLEVANAKEVGKVSMFHIVPAEGMESRIKVSPEDRCS